MEKKTKCRAVLILTLSLVLSGCSTYSSSFSCGDAKGANCMSMDRVDRMIASGEIERFNEGQKSCRGRRCKTKPYVQENEMLIPANNIGTDIQHFNRGQ